MNSKLIYINDYAPTEVNSHYMRPISRGSSTQNKAHQRTIQSNWSILATYFTSYDMESLSLELEELISLGFDPKAHSNEAIQNDRQLFCVYNFGWCYENKNHVRVFQFVDLLAA